MGKPQVKGGGRRMSELEWKADPQAPTVRPDARRANADRVRQPTARPASPSSSSSSRSGTPLTPQHTSVPLPVPKQKTRKGSAPRPAHTDAKPRKADFPTFPGNTIARPREAGIPIPMTQPHRPSPTPTKPSVKPSGEPKRAFTTRRSGSTQRPRMPLDAGDTNSKPISADEKPNITSLAEDRQSRSRTPPDMRDTGDIKPIIMLTASAEDRPDVSFAGDHEVTTFRDLQEEYGIRFVPYSDDLRGTNVLAGDVSADIPFLSGPPPGQPLPDPRDTLLSREQVLAYARQLMHDLEACERGRVPDRTPDLVTQFLQVLAPPSAVIEKVKLPNHKKWGRKAFLLGLSDDAIRLDIEGESLTGQHLSDFLRSASSTIVSDPRSGCLLPFLSVEVGVGAGTVEEACVRLAQRMHQALLRYQALYAEAHNATAGYRNDVAQVAYGLIVLGASWSFWLLAEDDEDQGTLSLARIWEGAVTRPSHMARAASILRYISFQSQARCTLAQEWLDMLYSGRQPQRTPAGKTPPPPTGPLPILNDTPPPLPPLPPLPPTDGPFPRSRSPSHYRVPIVAPLTAFVPEPLTYEPDVFRRPDGAGLRRHRSFEMLQPARRHSDFDLHPRLVADRTGGSMWTRRRPSAFQLGPSPMVPHAPGVSPMPLLPYVTGMNMHSWPRPPFLVPSPALPQQALPPSSGSSAYSGTRYPQPPLLSPSLTGPTAWAPPPYQFPFPPAPPTWTGDPRLSRGDDHRSVRSHSSHKSRSKARSARIEEPKTEWRRRVQSESRIEVPKKTKSLTPHTTGEKTKKVWFPNWLSWKS